MQAKGVSKAAQTDDRQQRIQQAVEEYLRLESRPEKDSATEFLAAHADLLPELEIELSKLRRVQAAWQRAQQDPATSDPTLSLALAGEDTNSTLGLRIRCAHCQTPLRISDDASLSDITCESCGGSFSILGEEPSHAPGVMLAHFRLVKQLGSGGFGTVWRAEDTELDRQVAIKIPRQGQIAPQRVEQFLREARTAAQLQHPGIVSVHEVGRDGDTVYIVSELISGITLDRWQAEQSSITPSAAAVVCRHVAVALEYAHQRGVVHRDLKPQNIMVDEENSPHLMDFGLARRDSGEITVTLDGNVLGTPAYMSPEQARGEAHHVDARTDIYSLGVVLFQLLTGQLPFRGDTRKLLYQVVHGEPPRPRSIRPNLPKDLETICLKCLEKEPTRRYASAQAVVEDLDRFLEGMPIQARPVSRIERSWRWCRRSPAQAALATAVLILVSTLGVLGMWPSTARDTVVDSLAVVLHSADDDESPYLRDQLTRALHRRFSEFSNLAVLPRSRILKYEDQQDMRPGDLARDLDVDAVLIGHVDEVGDRRVRLRLRLIARHDDRVLWERWDNPYDIQADQLPGVEQGIVRAIAHIGLQLTGEEENALRVNPNVDPAAFQSFLNGKRLVYRFTLQSLEQAEKEFLTAVELEPGFAEAHAGLAEVYFGLAYSFKQPDGYYRKAQESVNAAIAIDEMLTDALVVQGALDYFRNWNWKRAQEALDLALDRDPSLIERNACYLHMLAALGRPDEAVSIVESALVGQPNSEWLRVEHACSLYYAHQFDRSLGAIQAVLDAPGSANPFNLWNRARANNQLQKHLLAIADCEMALEQGDHAFSGLYAELGYAFARQQDLEGAKNVIRELERIAEERYVDPYEFAMVYAGLAEIESNSQEEFVKQTFDYLDLAADVKSAWLPSLNTDPKFKHLKHHDRFRTLMGRIGFAQWQPLADLK